MKVAILGSRNFKNQDFMFSFLDTWFGFEKFANLTQIKIDEVVSGGASGVDTIGKDWAEKRNIEFKLFRPNWKEHGKKAGMVRNVEIVEYSDFLLFFWDGKSSGTKHSISVAQKMKKQYHVIAVPKIEFSENNLEDFGF